MELVEVALKAAEEGAKVLKSYYQNLSSLQVEEKAKNDYVTEADKKSEMIIIKTIQTYFPQHTIVAEEFGGVKGNEYRWFVDPLDGTKNFIHGLPVFCVSVAVEREGELLAAVINAPALGEVFVAEKGGGAYCNGKKIEVSKRSFEEALIATGFPFRGKALLDQYLKCFKEIFLKVSGIRRCGSAALDLAFTAKGVFDGFWEMSLHPWDIAAGALLVEEAGGKVSDFKGEKGYLESGNVIGASLNTFHPLLELVRSHLS